MGDFGIAGLWLFLALALIVSTMVGVGSVWLANRTLSKSVAKEYNSTLSPFLTCVGLVYGALLGFTIVVAWEQFSSAEANVANEASTSHDHVPADRRHARAGAGPAARTAPQLRAAVEGPEWLEQRCRRAHQRTTHAARAALTDMYRVLGQ